MTYLGSFVLFCLTITVIIRYYRGIIRGNKKLIEQLSTKIENLESQVILLDQKNIELQQNNALTERIALICKQSPNAIMLMDDNGNIDWVNRGFEKMYGYDYDTFTATLGTNIRQTSFNPAISDRLARCSDGEIVQYDALNITKYGKTLWTRTALIPIYNEQKRLISMVTIDTDIHRLKLAGDQLVESTVELQKQLQKIGRKFTSLSTLTNRLFHAIEESERIFSETDKIAHFIKEVSNQTKILGVNASIEAQRAGEVGSGFRVVAGEIVRVSESTKNSALQINTILDAVKSETGHIRKEKSVIESAFHDHEALIERFTSEIQDLEELIDVIRAD